MKPLIKCEKDPHGASVQDEKSVKTVINKLRGLGSLYIGKAGHALVLFWKLECHLNDGWVMDWGIPAHKDGFCAILFTYPSKRTSALTCTSLIFVFGPKFILAVSSLQAEQSSNMDHTLFILNFFRSF